MRTGQFHTKVVGVTHENTDGSHRQQIVRRCQVGEAVRFCLEPWNEYDRNAIAVQRLTGEQLGYLSRNLPPTWLSASPEAKNSQGRFAASTPMREIRLE